MQKQILLVTLNSTYQHTSFGLRYLKANLGDLAASCEIIEFTIQKDPKDIAEQILQLNPKILGFGVYIWNTTQTNQVISLIKKVKPEIDIIIGGPEVSYETESQKIYQTVDFVIKGEADFLFRELCEKIISGQVDRKNKIIGPSLPNIKDIQLPYHLYSQEDIQNRLVYVEVSRGCPYRCEYCLSSLDKSVRTFDLDLFINEMQKLIDRGARVFKFIDRTFNLSIPICTQILEFFLNHIELDLFLHFEMVPDRLPSEIRDLIKKFPHGSIQFEVGIQTWNPEVAKNVSRRNDLTKVKENFYFLANETGVHTHADLIVGLPGENIQSFAHGFDELYRLGPDEIQVGILKRLKGTPITRHDQNFQMVYSEDPPFQILKTKDVSFEEMQKMNRFAKYWDLIANSGQFKQTMKLIEELSQSTESKSLFWTIFRLSEFMHQRHHQSFGIALLNLTESVWLFLTTELKVNQEKANQAIIQDYCLNGKRDLPNFLKKYVQLEDFKHQQKDHLKSNKLRQRQEMHQRGTQS